MNKKAVRMSSQAFLRAVKEQQKRNQPLSIERLRQINKEVEAGPSEKAKPPKGRAVALSTTSQELFMKSGDSLNYA